MNYPLLSFIIPTIGNNYSLFLLIESIKSQTINCYEVIIVGSELRKDYIFDLKESLNSVRYKFFSITAKGVYNAFNFGLSKANGEYVYFIGDDDVLIDNELIKSLYDVNKKIQNKSLVTFKVKLGRKKIIRPFLGFKTLLFNTLHHQGTFYPMEIFRNFTYNESLKAISDYELSLSLYLKKFRIFEMKNLGCKVALNGLSNNLDCLKLIEEFNISRSRALKTKPTMLFLLNIIFMIYVYLSINIKRLFFIKNKVF